jgi:ABC-type transport system involved in multi-copper enzyme maturation permease subunit
MRLALAGVRKFSTRTATIVSLIIAVALVGLEFIFIGIAYRSAPQGSSGLDDATVSWLLQFPGAYDGVLSIAFGLGGLIGLIYVASACGSEWSWGTLKVAVARGESRTYYVVATFASLALVLLAGMLITFAAGVAAALAGASIAGLSPGTIGDLPTLADLAVKLVRCWIALASLASISYTIAMVAKNQMAGIGAVIGFFLASIIAPGLMPELVQQIFRYLPFSITSDAIGLRGPQVASAGPSIAIDPTIALAVTIAWLVGSLAVAAIATERTEITG